MKKYIKNFEFQKHSKQLEIYGYTYIPSIVQKKQVVAFQQEIDNLFANPKIIGSTYQEDFDDYTLVRLFELHQCFRDLLDNNPIIEFAEYVLGTDCHLIADGCIRNYPGKAISRWHVDDKVLLPCLSKCNNIIVPPILQMTVMIPLTDIDKLCYGPTQVVPRSQTSGQEPPNQKQPIYINNKPKSIYAKKGDIYIFNGQIWHRGAENNSKRTRYIYQMTFGPRWISQRFYPYLNYKLPAEIMQECSKRQLRMLGKHVRGAYG